MTTTLLTVSPAAAVERADELSEELLTGSGYLRIEQAFTPAQTAEARELLIGYSATEDEKITHFLGRDEDKLHLQRRVWNLLDKGEVFEAMAQHPAVMAVVGGLLGNGFVLGSIAANRLLPGAPGQEPHIDYPYWDFYDQASFPRNLNGSFALNCQATILLDDFTEENGATAFVPSSQHHLVYPSDDSNFDELADRMTGRAGDVVLFTGMCWHAAQPNRSDRDRVGVLIEYLPKFVVPLEDLIAGVRQEVKDRATPTLRRLMRLDAEYPTVLDRAAGGTAEGRYGADST